jgi:hypothetical protein
MVCDAGRNFRSRGLCVIDIHGGRIVVMIELASCNSRDRCR